MVTVELTRLARLRAAWSDRRVAAFLGDIDAPGVDNRNHHRKFGIPAGRPIHRKPSPRRRDGRRPSPTKNIRGRKHPFSSWSATVTNRRRACARFRRAITIEKLPSGHYWLGVHIADFSTTVEEGSRSQGGLDRGTPVYFPSGPSTLFPLVDRDRPLQLGPALLSGSCQSCFMENRVGVARWCATSSMYGGSTSTSAMTSNNRLTHPDRARPPRVAERYDRSSRCRPQMSELFPDSATTSLRTRINRFDLKRCANYH